VNTFTSNDAKQRFGEVIELALQEPVSITHDGRPSVVVTSDAVYRELLSLKYEGLKEAVVRGFESFGEGEPEGPPVDEIAAAVLSRSTER
jgi:prevent-host-death family protein